MITNLRIKNFKRLENVDIELGKTVVFIGPNNSGKTTALQALALWEVGLRKWLEKRSAKETPEKRPGITINRRDLIAVPVPDSNLLWRDSHVRVVQRANGRPNTKNIRIDILVSGVNDDQAWDCGFEFDYANEESVYCRPLRQSDDAQAQRMPVPPVASSVRVAFLPPMSGLSASEDRLDSGAVDARIGEGRTAEVLRNLCYRVHSDKEGGWAQLCDRMKSLFGVELNPPRYVPERGQITMSYRESSGAELDLASSGRGLQQTLLLLAHLYTHRGAVLLLDEPDAHLEILRQRQIYQLLTQTADMQGCQIIAASHSEVLLNEAADRDIVVAFVGQPHRIDDRGSQLLKSLRAIGFDQYYQAEQRGWVLYLEGSTDLAILREFASLLGHPAKSALELPFVHYVANQPQKARDHFFGLRGAKADLVGVALFDAIPEDLRGTPAPLTELKWQQCEIENYLSFPETLTRYAEAAGGEAGPLFQAAEQEKRVDAMRAAIDEVTGALNVLRKPAPFTRDSKASEFLGALFESYFRRLGTPNLMQKTDYHTLAKYTPIEKLALEITEKLDAIHATALQAAPQ